VHMLQLLIAKTDKNASSLFHQYNREAVFSPSNTVWFADKALSKRSFGNFLGDICKAANVLNHYTPHCVRATAIQLLNDEGYEARQIMYMSDHKCESSSRSYNNTFSTAQKRSLSSSLSAIIHAGQAVQPTAFRAPAALAGTTEHAQTAQHEVVSSSQRLPPATISVNATKNITETPGFFSNASFSGCTINIST
jgi:hypothetical protein